MFVLVEICSLIAMMMVLMIELMTIVLGTTIQDKKTHILLVEIILEMPAIVKETLIVTKILMEVMRQLLERFWKNIFDHPCETKIPAMVILTVIMM